MFQVKCEELKLEFKVCLEHCFVPEREAVDNGVDVNEEIWKATSEVRQETIREGTQMSLDIFR
jgi:hypothetical protein